MTQFYIGQDDRLPTLTKTLADNDGPLNLTGATVTLYARKIAGSTTFSGSASIVGDAEDGNVSYAWANGDTQLPGGWYMQWRVTIAGKTLTVPNNGADEIWIDQFWAGDTYG